MPDVLLVCPTCGAEYVTGVAGCSDCRVALVAPTPAPDLLAADEDAVEVWSTFDASVARGWHDVLTAAGVAQRINVTGDADPESPPRYLLLVDARDADWAFVLACIVDEQPSVDAAEAVRQATEQMNAESADASDVDPDIDAAMFDVPDLLPPPEVATQIAAAESIATVGMVLAVLFAAAAAGVSMWWAIPALIAAVESVRARRRAAARLAEWRQSVGWEPPTQ